MVDQALIDEIRVKNDIVEVIGEHLPLKKVGRNYRALCPFHSDSHPSFYVSPEKQIFYCFGCQKGGNVFNFIMDYEAMGFYEALKKLGERVGIEIKGKARGRYDHLYELNDLTADIYHNILYEKRSQIALDYYHKRGIEDSIIKDFKLGFAPQYARLIVTLEKKGYRREDLIRNGLIVGTHRELFRNRIVFPIRNLAGKIIGFGGRAIDENTQPKYLNSPETPIFKKRDNLFGLSKAKKSIINNQEVFIVEGYFDLLSLYQNGYKNVVAPLGTAISKEHGLLLSRYAKKALILFDADPSGIKAAIRSIGRLLSHMDVKVVELPPDTDPDMLVRRDKGEFDDYLNQAVDFIDFIRHHRQVDDIGDEVALIHDLMKTINQTSDSIRLDRYVKRISMAFGVNESTLRQEVKKQPTKKKKTLPRMIEKEGKLLFLALQSGEHLELIRKETSPKDFVNPRYDALKELVFSSNRITLPNVLDNIGDELKEELIRFSFEAENVGTDKFHDNLHQFHLRCMLAKIQTEASQLAKEGKFKELGEKQKEIARIKRDLLSKEEVMDEA